MPHAEARTDSSRLAAWLEPVEDDIRYFDLELDSTEMIKRFVMAGLGVGFLRIPTVRKSWPQDEFSQCGLGPEPWLVIGLIYRKGQSRFPRPRWASLK